MNDRTPCATPEALVTYLYEECDPAERQSIAAHVAGCASCADEIEALSDTRAHLASWSPPALPLGFQITRTEIEMPAKVLRPAAWYRQPLPAWAQMAAAVAIFAAGMSVSAFRSSAEQSGEERARVVDSSAPQTVSTADARSVDDFRVTRAEFARFDARLRAVESADAYRASYQPRTVASVDDSDLRARMSALEDRFVQSEGETLTSLAKLARAVDANSREVDGSRQVLQKVNQLEVEVQEHRQVFTSFPALAVRTALTSSGR
jgi:hypothetical protein